MVVNLGLCQIDNVVDLGLCVDKDNAATFLLNTMIHNDDCNSNGAAANNTSKSYLNVSLPERRHRDPTVIHGQEPRARGVIKAQLVVTQGSQGWAQEEGAFLWDVVPPNRDKDGLLEHAHLWAEGCFLSGKEVCLVNGDQFQGSMVGAEDGGAKENCVGGKEVWQSK
jgi:hypothetical protein